MSFCSKVGRGDELLRRFATLSIAQVDSGHAPHVDTRLLGPTSPSNMTAGTVDISSDNKDLSILIMAMRKLREGIVASKRVDSFSIQAYIFCIRLSILLKHMESYHPAILHLLKSMHPVQALTGIELQEFAGYLVLDLTCRQHDYAQAYAVRNHYDLRDSKVLATLDSLVHDDYNKFWKIKKSVDGHKAKLMEFAEESMRSRALKCLGRAYLNIDLGYLEQATGTTWTALVSEHNVGWTLDDKKVVIRKPKGS